MVPKLAPQIRVNAIVPGGVERNTAAAFRRKYAARTPLARMATEEDLKGAAAYLASDLSAYVTGQCLMVDGGWSDLKLVKRYAHLMPAGYEDEIRRVLGLCDWRVTTLGRDTGMA